MGLGIFKKVYELLRRILKRRFRLIFFSPARAMKVACRKPLRQNTLAFLNTIGHDDQAAKAISVYENVIASPLTEAAGDQKPGIHYFGGLVDPQTQALIPEAIHRHGETDRQSLPATYAGNGISVGCPIIRRPVLYGGILYNHFGHFIVESLSRLYAYPMVRDVDPFVLFYSQWGLPRYLEKNNFVNQILSGFGIPVDRLIIVDRAVRINQIVIPAQKYGFGFIRHPDEMFVRFIREFRFQHKIPEGFKEAEKIYVSRSGLKNKGRQIGEKFFEAYLEGEGYRIFYPERYTFFEQLTVYARAGKLIFAEGSALFSCMFLPEMKADIAVVCRRRNTRGSLREATDCLSGFGKNILWIDAVLGQYQFGLDTWDALAEIDWREVSRLLCEQGFVRHPLGSLRDDEHLALVRSELGPYLREISGNPKFVDHMMQLKQIHPLRTDPFDSDDFGCGSEKGKLR